MTPIARCIPFTIAIALTMAGCGDSGRGGFAPAGGTAGDPGPGGSGGDPGTGGTIGAPDPPGLAQGAHSSLFAVSHSYEGTPGEQPSKIVYRVSVPQWTDPKFGNGDGSHNGFYYQVSATPGQALGSDSGLRVPFNGFRMGTDGSLNLAPFEFIVVADAAMQTLNVKACAVRQDVSTTNDDTNCENPFWTDQYGGQGNPALPTPELAPDVLQQAQEVDFTVTVDISSEFRGIPTSGVAAVQLTVELDPNQGFDEATTDWIFDHLVFVTYDTGYVGRPLPNDLFRAEGTGDDSFNNVGFLPIDKGAVCEQGDCWLRYTTADTVPPFSPPEATETNRRDYLVYTRSGQSELNPAAAVLTDLPSTVVSCSGAESCPCLMNPSGIDCGPKQTLDETNLAPTRLTTYPLPTQSEVQPAFTTKMTLSGGGVADVDAAAGSAATRQIKFSGTTTCGEVVNPVANNGLGPNYVITLKDSELPLNGSPQPWPVTLKNNGQYQTNGLYYVVPPGFGPCDDDWSPFCDNARNRGNYVPHYTNNVQGDGCEEIEPSAVNGGGSTDPRVTCATFADQYAINGDNVAGSLVYFDNCGWGHTFSDAAGVTPGRRKRSVPPSPYREYDYSVTNDHPFPVVIARECCMNYFLGLPSGVQNIATTATDMSPSLQPPQMKDSFGTYLGPGATVDSLFTYFPDQTMVVYHGLTGAELYKLRVRWDDYASAIPEALPGAPHLYACENQSAGVTDGSSASVSLGSGSLSCEQLPSTCPWGMTDVTASAAPGGPNIVCQATTSDFILGTKDWAGQFDSATPIRLMAWGADGYSALGKSKGGDRGYAATVLMAEDFASPRGYVLLVGRTATDTTSQECEVANCGGSATSLFANAGLGAFRDGNGDAADAMYLLAGGGGAAACVNEAASGSFPGGGNGAAYGLGGPPGTAQTHNALAGNGGGHPGWEGKGAQANGKAGGGGSADISGQPGTDGIGGVATAANGTCNSFWYEGRVPALVRGLNGNFSPGRGGAYGRASKGANHANGGGGGAGYGGGGGGTPGKQPNFNKWGGGGGGGSTARKNTTVDPTWTNFPFPPGYPNFPVFQRVRNPNVPNADAYAGGPFLVIYPPATSRGFFETQAFTRLLQVENTVLQFQPDGNLVVVDYSKQPPAVLWAPTPAIQNRGGNQVAFRSEDGNLVVTASGNTLWQTGTVNVGATTLSLSITGRLSILDADSNPIWSNGL